MRRSRPSLRSDDGDKGFVTFVSFKVNCAAREGPLGDVVRNTDQGRRSADCGTRLWKQPSPV
jgi:hypothetical protein